MISDIPLGLWLGAGGALAFGVVYSLETRRRGLELIARWAVANRLQIITAQRRAFAPLGGQWKGISFFRIRQRCRFGYEELLAPVPGLDDGSEGDRSVLGRQHLTNRSG